MMSDVQIVGGSSVRDFGRQCRQKMASCDFYEPQMKMLERKSWSYFAQIHDKIVGVIVIGPTSFQGKHAMSIDYLVVEPQFQKQGIGTRLMNKAVEMYGSHMDILLDYFEDSLQRFYESFGFRDYASSQWSSTCFQ